MHILAKIQSLRTALQDAEQTDAGDQVIALLKERITELESKAGCSCSLARSQTPQQIKEKFNDLRAQAILANARVTRCPLHGPVIPAREIEKEKEL